MKHIVRIERHTGRRDYLYSRLPGGMEWGTDKTRAEDIPDINVQRILTSMNATGDEYTFEDAPDTMTLGPHPASAVTAGPHLDRVNTLFDPAEFLPAHMAKRMLQQRPKTVAHNARFGGPTKVVRIPESWDREELLERIELMHSLLLTAEEEIAEAKARSGNGISNRFEKLAGFVAEARTFWKKDDQYDPFAEDSQQ